MFSERNVKTAHRTCLTMLGESKFLHALRTEKTPFPFSMFVPVSREGTYKLLICWLLETTLPNFGNHTTTRVGSSMSE